jgi:hypothetical protein
MCSRGGLLYAFDDKAKRCLVTDADCNSWRCPECRARMKDRWTLNAQHGARVLMDQGHTLYFATITSHEKLTTFAACAAVFPSAWSKLHKRLNRLAETREYFLVPERHQDGRMHVHAIWTFPVSTRWLKDNGRACGFGYKNQIGRRGHVDERIEDIAQVSQYVSKYLAKSLGDETPAHFRRVRVSRGWQSAPQAENEYSKLDWRYVGGNGKLDELYAECDARDMLMIDIRTGEIFDDVDLGTISTYTHA